MSVAAPGSVLEVRGHDAVMERITSAVMQGPRHAYVLAGPAHIGKARVATAFAAALICPERSEEGVPCGVCSSCRRIARGVHPDVGRFDLASQAARDDAKSRNATLNIATVREIGRMVALRPMEAAWRVVIVDDVETMQETAQEAFLKTLEEPPRYVVILLLTSDIERLVPTVLSRCQVIAMAPVAQAVISATLREHDADGDLADALSTASLGRIGTAIAARDDAALRERLLAAVEDAAAWVRGDAWARMVQAVKLADGFTENRALVYERLSAAEAAWRALLFDATGSTAPVDHPIVRAHRLRSVEDGTRALAALHQCLRDLEANVRPRAALETMVLAWPPLIERSS